MEILLLTVTTNPTLRAIALCAAITNLCGRTIIVLLPLYLVRTAGYRPATIGLLFATGSLGFLIGAATADHTAGRFGLRPAILTGAIIACASFLLIAAAPTRAAGPFTATALFVYGIGALTFTVNNTTLRQLSVPSQLLGRTTAAMRQLIWIAQPVAGLLAAWLGSHIGLRAAIGIAALTALTAPLPLLTTKLTQPTTAIPQTTGNT